MHITPPVLSRLPHAGRFRQRLLHASLLAGLGLSFSSPMLSLAADDDVLRLQQENARLTEEIEALKRRYQQGQASPSEAKQSEINSAKTNSAEANAAAANQPVAHAASTTEPTRGSDNAAALGAVIVTSRNREEIAQDVPIPVSVIGAQKLDRERIFTVDDLTRVTPGLTATTPNARRSGISIRGIGKSTGDESLEAAVGTIVDDVYLSLPGMTYQDFTDLDRVEVLRGPQGTLLGKNTTMGAINYVSKAPSFTRQTYFETESGCQPEWQ